MRSARLAKRLLGAFGQLQTKHTLSRRGSATAAAATVTQFESVLKKEPAQPRNVALLYTQLDAALYPPSPSYRAPQPAIRPLLAVVTNIISSGKTNNLASYDKDIVIALTSFLRSKPALDPEERAKLESILGYCWRLRLDRSAGIQGHGAFAEYCLTEAVDAVHDPVRLSHVKSLLDNAFLQIPAQYHGRKLPAARSVTASDALVSFLLDKKGTWMSPAQIELPTIGDITSAPEMSVNGPYVSALAGKLGQTPEELLADFVEYLGRSLDDKILTTAASVDVRLRSYRRRGDYNSIVELWDRIRAQMAGDLSNPLPIDMTQRTERDTLFASFLYVFYAPFQSPPASSQEPPFDRERLKRLAQRVLAMAPKPFSLKIYHTLLALSSEGAELTAPNNAAVLTQLKDHWKQAAQSGVVMDVKAYMLFMEGLGRRGDVEALKSAWSALAADEACKQLYLQSAEAKTARDSTGSAPFPPVSALNQVISLCLAMPKSTSAQAIGLHLFNQASQPGSALRPDIYTINTVLRHHARKADLEGMLQLFGHAAQLGIKPDVVTFTTLVQGFLKAGQPDNAAKIIKTMLAQGIQPNDRLYSMLIADLSQTGNRAMLSAAEDILTDMKNSKVPVSIVTWTGLASGYFRGGWVTEGFDAIRRMRASGTRPNRVAYNMILRNVADLPSGQARGYGGLSSLEILRMMKSDGAKPDADTWFIILDGLARARKWEEAKLAVKEMEASKFDHRGKASLRRLVQRIAEAE